MSFPLSSLDISVWLTFMAVVLVATAEVASHFGPAHGLLVDRSKLRMLALTTSIVLFAIVISRILQFL